MRNLAVCLMVVALAAGCSGTQPAAQSASPTSTASVAKTVGAVATPAAAATAGPASSAPTPVPTTKPSSGDTSSVPVLGKEYSFEQVVTVSGQQAQTMRIATKGNKIRLEIAGGGNQLVMIGNPDQKAAYMMVPGEKQALKIPYDQMEAQMNQVKDPGVLSKDALSGQLVGSESVDGKACDVYSYSSPFGTSKVWIWKEKGFPLKAEVSGSGQTISIQYRNVQVGGVADSLFELPAGMEVVDLGSLPGMMGMPTMPPISR